MTNKVFESQSVEEMIQNLIKNLSQRSSEIQEDYEKNKKESSYTALDVHDAVGLLDLYTTLLNLRQWDDNFDPKVDGICPFRTRLVKVKKFIDPITRIEHADSLKMHLVGGMFLELEICFIPSKFVKVGKAVRGTESIPVLFPPSEPDLLGLPSNKEVIWSTVRDIGNSNYYAAIACRGNQAWMKEWLTRASSWEYVLVE